MTKHLKYLKYVLRHKFFVLLGCLQYGLIWRGIVHDLSKFSPVEWFAYAGFFYGGWRQDNYSGKSEAPAELKLAYDRAWNHHQKANSHHWQHHVLLFDGGDESVLPMPDADRKEMLADWRGAGRALGFPDTRGWYLKNKDKMKFHPDTRAWVEKELNI